MCVEVSAGVTGCRGVGCGCVSRCWLWMCVEVSADVTGCKGVGCGCVLWCWLWMCVVEVLVGVPWLGLEVLDVIVC